MRTLTGSLILSVVLLVTLAPTAPAEVVTYADRLDWEAATIDQRDIDFTLTPALALNTGRTFSTFSGLTLDATGGIAGVDRVNFVGLFFNSFGDPRYEMSVWNAGSASDFYWNSGYVLVGPTYRSAGQGRIQATLPAGGTSGVGLDLRSVYPGGHPYQILVYSGTALIYTASPVTTVDPGPGSIHSFWGMTSSDAPITRLEIFLAGGTEATTRPIIDNFSYGTIGPTDPPLGVPEPETLYYVLGAGLALLGFRRVRNGSPKRT